MRIGLIFSYRRELLALEERIARAATCVDAQQSFVETCSDLSEADAAKALLDDMKNTLAELERSRAGLSDPTENPTET